MKFYLKFIIFSIGVLNNPYSVYLASISSTPKIAIPSSTPLQLGSSTATALPVVSRRTKPTVAAHRQNQYYDLPDYGSTPAEPPVFGQEENTFPGEEVPYPEIQDTSPQDDLLDGEFALPGESETLTIQEAVPLPSVGDQDQGLPFEAEIYDTDPQTAQDSYVTSRSSTSQVTPAPAVFRATAATPKTTLNSLLRDGEVIDLFPKRVVTQSTYPFFPDGSTPKKDPEPVETLMCGIAKCLELKWKDQFERRFNGKNY